MFAFPAAHLHYLGQGRLKGIFCCADFTNAVPNA